MGSFVIVLALVFVASWLAIAVPGFRGAITSTSKPAILSRAKAGHKCGKGYHGLQLFLAEVSGEPLISDAIFKGREGFGIRMLPLEHRVGFPLKRKV